MTGRSIVEEEEQEDNGDDDEVDGLYPYSTGPVPIPISSSSCCPCCCRSASPTRAPPPTAAAAAARPPREEEEGGGRSADVVMDALEALVDAAFAACEPSVPSATGLRTGAAALCQGGQIVPGHAASQSVSALRAALTEAMRRGERANVIQA